MVPWRRLVADACIYLILMMLAVSWGIPVEALPGPASGNSGLLTGVAGFQPDYDSGNMGLHALLSCLEFCGENPGYYKVVGLSRSAFKFVYDSTEAYEPLRDLDPADALGAAAGALGFTDCGWVTGLPIDEVKLLIKKEIDDGRPLIAPFFLPDYYNGFYIITGYDFDKGILYLQGGHGRGSGYISIPFGAPWDGPTLSPAGWAVNPVFVLGEKHAAAAARGKVEREAMVASLDLLRGGTLEYGTSPGETEYVKEPGPHTARYGLPAYEILSSDVGGAPLLVSERGRQAVNTGLLWRLNSQLGMLYHDRFYGLGFLRGLTPLLEPGHNMVLGEVAGNMEGVLEDVRSLRRIFWDILPDTLASAEGALRHVEESGSIVYVVPDRKDIRDRLRREGYETHPTPWGRVVIADAPEKRLAARVLVKRIASREKNSLHLLSDIVQHIGGPRSRPVMHGGDPVRTRKPDEP
jgi:hypothetical protein